MATRPLWFGAFGPLAWSRKGKSDLAVRAKSHLGRTPECPEMGTQFVGGSSHGPNAWFGHLRTRKS
eukprot:1225289-Lingulodinium_polyedra.AAC.1